MRRSLFVALALGMFLGGPVAADAALQLAPIMHAWRANLHVMDAALSGKVPSDPDQLRRAVQGYLDDATLVAGRLHGHGAQAQDFRNRFLFLAAEGRNALGDIGQPAKLKVDAERIKATCASCHAAYNN